MSPYKSQCAVMSFPVLTAMTHLSIFIAVASVLLGNAAGASRDGFPLSSRAACLPECSDDGPEEQGDDELPDQEAEDDVGHATAAAAATAAATAGCSWVQPPSECHRPHRHGQPHGRTPHGRTPHPRPPHGRTAGLPLRGQLWCVPPLPPDVTDPHNVLGLSVCRSWWSLGHIRV